ncbi:MAG: type I-U CRISPR-associated protein Csb2 [Acidimicrobiales bacterium]
MITITVELLNGVLRASSGEAVTGSTGTTVAEWPPSPARLFAALVAGGGSDRHNRVGSDDDELRLLESATPPLIAATRREDVAVSSLEDRYVVLDERKANRVHEYPGRQSGLVRPGQRAAPRSPFITYVWPEIEPSDLQVAALRRRAARIAYLGTADSPVRVMVNRPVDRDGRDLWQPDVGGSVALPVPYVGYLAALDRGYEAFRAGASPRGMRVPRARVAYRPPGGPSPSQPEPVIVWLVLDRGLPTRQALATANALRGLVLRAYSDRFGEPPPVLHGHGVERGSQHARYLPLPDIGHRHARGRILGAAIWLPPATRAEVLGNLRLALQASTGRLTLPGGGRRIIRLRAEGEARPWAANPRRWTQPATEFATAFPAVHQRFGPIDDARAAVSTWCTDAGLPEPVAADVSRAPYFPGIPRFEAREVWRDKSTKGYPYSHVRLRFAEPVAGPVAIGRGRSFGLGLLAPFKAGRFGTDAGAETRADAADPSVVDVRDGADPEGAADE